MDENPVSEKDYVKINNLFNKFLIGKVLEGHEVMLPARMGIIEIVGTKQKVKVDDEGKITGLAPDWVKTRELWEINPQAKKEKKLVYFTNFHTDGVRYKYFWSKAYVLVSNKILYSLRMTRTNKRAVAKMIKDFDKQYKVK